MTDYAATAKIEDLASYLTAIKNVQAEWEAADLKYYPRNLWFRGQADDWPLLPKIMRLVVDQDSGKTTLYNELAILEAFTSLYRNYVTERFEERSTEFFSFMQHNGVPTRLLDWTESAMMALYFAVADVRLGASELPVVWIMAPGFLNQYSLNLPVGLGAVLSENPFVGARMWMIGYVADPANWPIDAAERPVFDGFVQRQVSDTSAGSPTVERATCYTHLLFTPGRAATCASRRRRGVSRCMALTHFPSSLSISDVAFLRKVIIDPTRAGPIREELRVTGITPLSVFPDLEGLSQELNGRQYFSRSPA